MKRPAAAASGAAAKKSKGGSMSKQFKEVATALKEAEGYPPQVISMLSENLPNCLSETKEERHEFQVKVCSMLEEVLGSVQASCEKKLAEANSKLSEADSIKVSREAAEAAAKTATEAAKESAETAKKDLDAATSNLKSKNSELKAAKNEQEAGDAELLQAEDMKSKIESIVTEVFGPCKEGTLDASKVKSGIAEVCKLGKEFSFDAALMHSLPSALAKAPGVRGSFDELVVKQVEGELEGRKEKLLALLKEGESGRAERAKKVADAEGAVAEATSSKTAKEDALKGAQAAEKEALAAEKAAEKARKGFGAEMKEVQASLEEATSGLESFTGGPLATFQELLNRSSVVPVEPAEEAAPAQEVAA